MIKIEKNYKMVMAGKEYIIPEVKLTLSRANPENFVLTHEESFKIAVFVAKKILNYDSLTLEEIEFLREITNSDANEVIKGLFANITVSWVRKNFEKLNNSDINTIKTFFMHKINGL